MADNYLEKRMEDYRSGKLSKPRQSAAHQSPRRQPHSPRLRFKKVLVAVASDRLREALTATFSSGGCRTAFCHTDARRGQLEAQRGATLFCPISDFSAQSVGRCFQTVSDRWGGVDAVVADSADLTASVGVPVILLSDVEGEDPRSMAAAAFSLVTEAAALVKLIEK